ncbi:hypothetical protein SUGI_0544170 [Cryptomeria japonica]|nr:hypothetical protein SUGI_0544170 [Cryptomeria japonica]
MESGLDGAFIAPSSLSLDALPVSPNSSACNHGQLPAAGLSTSYKDVVANPAQALPDQVVFVAAGDRSEGSGLGGLNACFLYKREGHLRKNCPIVLKSKPHPKPNPSPAINKVSPPVPNEPISDIPNLAHSADQSSLHFVAGSPGDDFQLVVGKSKKRQRKNTPISDKCPSVGKSKTPAKKQDILELTMMTRGSTGKTHSGSVVKSIVQAIEDGVRSSRDTILGLGLARPTLMHGLPEVINDVLAETPANGGVSIGANIHAIESQLKEIGDEFVINVIPANPNDQDYSSQVPSSPLDWQLIPNNMNLHNNFSLMENLSNDENDIPLPPPKPKAVQVPILGLEFRDLVFLGSFEKLEKRFLAFTRQVRSMHGLLTNGDLNENYMEFEFGSLEQPIITTLPVSEPDRVATAKKVTTALLQIAGFLDQWRRIGLSGATGCHSELISFFSVFIL